MESVLAKQPRKYTRRSPGEAASAQALKVTAATSMLSPEAAARRLRVACSLAAGEDFRTGAWVQRSAVYRKIGGALHELGKMAPQWLRGSPSVFSRSPLRMTQGCFRLDLGFAPEVVSLTAVDLCSHGLISGVTGSGKTSSAKIIAESLSASGVPVFAVDAKGDFAGISQTQAASGRYLQEIDSRENSTTQPPPVIFWDPSGVNGHRISLQPAKSRQRGPLLSNLRRIHSSGAGYVGVLQAENLLKTPHAYSEFVFQLLLQLGDQPENSPAENLCPQLVVLIEEAHLVFNKLQDRELRAIVEALGRLSENGIAVVFIAPDPGLAPEDVDAALGFRIQHGLWTFSKETMRRLERRLDGEGAAARDEMCEIIRSLGIGEAVVSLPNQPGWRRTSIRRPMTRDGAITDAERRSIIAATSRAGELSLGVPTAARSIGDPRPSSVRRARRPHVRSRTRGRNAR